MIQLCRFSIISSILFYAYSTPTLPNYQSALADTFKTSLRNDFAGPALINQPQIDFFIKKQGSMQRIQF